MHVLIAAPSDILRVGLRAIFETHPSVSNVIEVTTNAELIAYLETNVPDRIIIHQSLIEDITALIECRFASGKHCLQLSPT
jgi:DNA-binding NarL/FixJ family response regulator